MEEEVCEQLLLSDIIRSYDILDIIESLQDLDNFKTPQPDKEKQLSKPTKLEYDIVQVEEITTYIISYLTVLKNLFEDIDRANIKDKSSLHWISNGKSELIEIHNSLESLDQIIPNLLTIAKTELNEFPNDGRLIELLNNFALIHELSLVIKEHLIPYKNKVDIAIRYNELNEQVMASINNEIIDCFKISLEIHELRFSSPLKYIPNLKLETITQMLNSDKNIHMNLRIPTFSSVDDSLYEKYTILQNKIEPIHASLMFIPTTLEHYSEFAKDYYPESILHLIERYEGLSEDFQCLKKESKNLKYELLDKRWEEVFRSFLCEIKLISSELEAQFKTNSVLDDNGTHQLKILDSAFEILKRAIGENLIKDSNTIKLQNDLNIRFLSIKDWVYKKAGSANVTSSEPCDQVDDIVQPDKSINRRNFSLGTVNVTNLSQCKQPRWKIGSTIIDALQLKPVMIEYNPTSAKKKAINPLEDISNTSRTNSSGSASSKKTKNTIIIQKLINEISKKENNENQPIQEPCKSDKSNIDEEFAKLELDPEEPFNRIDILNSPDPFLTPSARNRNRTILPMNSPDDEYRKPLKYVPLPVSSPPVMSHLRVSPPPQPSMLSKIPAYSNQKSRIPLPTRPESRQAIIRSESKLVSHRSQSSLSAQRNHQRDLTTTTLVPMERPHSRLERLGTTISSQLGTVPPSIASLRSKSVLVVNHSTLSSQSPSGSIPKPSPISAIKQKVRAQSSMGTGPYGGIGQYGGGISADGPGYSGRRVSSANSRITRAENRAVSTGSEHWF